MPGPAHADAITTQAGQRSDCRILADDEVDGVREKHCDGTQVLIGVRRRIGALGVSNVGAVRGSQADLRRASLNRFYVGRPAAARNRLRADLLERGVVDGRQLFAEQKIGRVFGTSRELEQLRRRLWLRTSPQQDDGQH